MTIPHHEMLDRTPAWSPDGQMLAFMSVRSGNGDIWVVPTEGGEARQLTEHPDSDGMPEWSVDGEWVHFISRRTGERCLWRVQAAGEEPEQLTKGPVILHRTSLDGKQIIFKRSGNIWGLSLEDGTEHLMADLEGQLGDNSLGFATDGEHLYFSWGRMFMDLWVMDVVQE